MAFFLALTVIQVVLQTQLVYNVNAENGVLRFMVLGDWGGLPFPMFNYSTAIERGVADGMARLANKKPQDFVIALGDNFYFTGVENVEDERFFLTYENVFHDQSLQIPWYVCAGNHDHYGNVSAQIAYTKKSNRWEFPSLFYSKTFAVQGTSTTVQLILIDTVLLCGNTASDQSETPLPGPKFPEMADRQLEWIVHEIRSSTADYILVGGHYPIYSAGMHGNTQILIDNLTPIFEKYDVTAFLAGHDHNNQHIIVNNLNYLVTGCATFAQDWPLKQDELPLGSLHFFWADGKELGGFIAFEANESSMNATFMSGTGLELHQVTMLPRKTKNKSKYKFQEI